MMDKFLFLVLVLLLLAAFFDFWLMRWLRRIRRQHEQNPEANDHAVYLFGRYSPFFSWLRNIPSTLKTFWKGRQERKMTIKEIEGQIPQSQHLDSSTSKRIILLEVAVIGLLVLFYCAGILDFRPMTQLPGNEAELFQSVDLILMNSLARYHQFPMWNPFIHTGLPFAGDPMLHIYNPVVTIPVLLFGVLNGFRIALVISFLLAAFGMRRLGGILGLGPAGRIWVALMYTFAGQPVARFFQGEYLFILGFAWIPWVIGNLFLLARTRRRLHMVYLVLSLALLYFCGNAYYPFLIMFVVVFFGLLYIFRLKPQRLVISIDTGLLKKLLVAGLLAFGMVSIHFLPLAEFWPRMNKGIDVLGSHSLTQIFLDYTSKDTFRPDAYEILPAREEFYAYIGLTPFIGLVLLPFAFFKRDKKPVLLFLLILIFSIVWVNMERMPWRDLYYQTKAFSQFRHLLRALIFGSLALIVLAGYGMDWLWKALSRYYQSAGLSNWAKARSYAAFAGLVLLGFFMAGGVADLFLTHEKYVNTVEDYEGAYRVMGWLRDYDQSEYYARHNPTNGWLLAVLSTNHRFIDAWYHWSDIRTFEGMVNERAVNGRPHYVVQTESEVLPEEPGAKVLHVVEGYNIIGLPHSLPFAFSVANSELLGSDKRELWAEDVTPFTPFFSGPNDLEVIAEGGENESLVVLVTHYPGWKASVDGQPAILKNIGGYLATDMHPGIHKYNFSYRPMTFFIGLAISLLCLIITVYLFVTDFQGEWQRLVAARRSWKAAAEKLLSFPGRFLPQESPAISAVLKDGVLHPEKPLELQEGASVQINIETSQPQVLQPRVAFRRWTYATYTLGSALVQSSSVGILLLGLVVAVYLAVRLVGLTQFPIYFFTDEAVQTNLAADLVRDSFHDPDHIFLPTYFKNSTFYNLSLSVYLQVIPYMLFGKSVLVTRLASVLVTLIAAVAVGLALKNVFKIRYWWSGPLLLSMAPAWFLHSRTAFETALFVSFYAGLLYCYLLYRTRSPSYIYATLIMAALAFYSYSPGQVVVGVTGLLLLVTDIRYHWRNRLWALKGVVLLAILAFPYIRFEYYRAGAQVDHLRYLDSYWLYPIPIGEKLLRFFREYFTGLNPFYWFFPNEHDLQRHVMKGYGHLSWLTLPFFLIGLVAALRNIRSPGPRLLVLALLAAPTGAALVGVGITRVLVFVIPATLTTALGLSDFLTWMENPQVLRIALMRISRAQWLDKIRIPVKALQIGLFVILLIANFSIQSDALRNGSTWFNDYGLYGMQYGGRQIFGELAPAYLQRDPRLTLFLSSVWANGADILANYFLTPEQLSRVQMGSVDTYLSEKRELDGNMVFVITKNEFNAVKESQVLKVRSLDGILPYPDGSPGFYIARLEYAPDADAIFAAEEEARRKLVEEQIELLDQDVLAKYSPIDAGTLNDLFDGDPNSLIRGLEANPFVFVLDFSKPIHIRGLLADFGSMDLNLKVLLYVEDSGEPITLSESFKGLSPDPHVEWTFPGGPYEDVVELRIEVLCLNESDEAKVHFRELKLIQ